MDKSKQTYATNQQGSKFGFICRDEKGHLILDLLKWNRAKEIPKDGREKGKLWEEGEWIGAEEKRKKRRDHLWLHQLRETP